VGESALRVVVNGEARQATVASALTLADFLREVCHLTGTYLGCEHGVCGACTVLVDGAAVRSCLMFAIQAEGAEITTIEGWEAPTAGSTTCSRRSTMRTGCSVASAHRDFSSP
jgi:carbon-monoxide dehydrogenase small subunit